jgi:hypothetical protein
MIDATTRAAVLATTTAYWQDMATKSHFQGLAAGKEIGHRIANYVDEHTTAKLFTDFDVAYEADRTGRRIARSMGDMWLRANGIYNPVNVKAGEMGKNGQPNLVSLKKLLERLLKHQIDSYDLLIVKMAISGEAADPGGVRLVPHVYFVDMLDHLDFVTFDMGPGQTRVRERQFYDAVDSGYQPPHRSLTDKVEVLMALMEDGYLRLLDNRKSRMDSLRRTLEQFKGEIGNSINQTGLNFGG